MNGPLAIATFGPIYEELVNALMRKAMYSLQENEWTADQREAFRCYRTDIADTIMYCYVSIFSFDFLLSQLEISMNNLGKKQEHRNMNAPPERILPHALMSLQKMYLLSILIKHLFIAEYLAR